MTRGEEVERLVADGLLATLVDADKKEHEFAVTSLARDDLMKQVGAQGAGAPKELILEGEMEAKTDGIYEFVVDVRGWIRIEVDGAGVLEDEPAGSGRQTYGVASLKAGWHHLKFRLVPAGPVDLNVLLAGDQVAVPLAGKSLRHPSR